MILIIRRYENFEEETTEDTTNDCSDEKTEIATLQGDLTKQENAAKQKETELNGKLTELQTKYDTDTKDLKSIIDELQGVESKYNNTAEKYSQIKNEFNSLKEQCNDNNSKLNNRIKKLKNQIVRCEKGEGFVNTVVNSTDNQVTNTSEKSANMDSDGKKTDSLDSDTVDNQQIMSLLNVNMESILGPSKIKKFIEDQITNDTRQNFRLNRLSKILYKF